MLAAKVKHPVQHLMAGGEIGFDLPFQCPQAGAQGALVREQHYPDRQPLGLASSMGVEQRRKGGQKRYNGIGQAGHGEPFVMIWFILPACILFPISTSMKLTITNPEVVDTLADLLGGLWPIRRGGDSRMILVVKASREMAQTAKLRGGFRFYLVPVHIGDVATYGLLTAFFDDYDEPLVIRTPLFNEEITQDFLSLLSSDSFYVHFFDEHDRELLGFRAENPDAHRFRTFSNTMRFVSPTLAHGRQVLDDLQVWFSARSPTDDDAAFTIHLREQLFSDSLAEHIANPGDFNEPDIAMALHRPFGGAHVFKNPIRADNGREFVDVLVATTETLLLIQAKDSPYTESALTRKIDRKRATAAKHVRNAAAQWKGSINHLRSGQSIEIITEGKHRQVSMSGRDIFGLVIVKELFDPDRPVCSPPVLTLYGETDTPCLLLDHTEFQELTFFQTSEESFVGALGEIFSVASAHGVFPRSRFGLRTGKSVVYQPRGTKNTLVHRQG